MLFLERLDFLLVLCDFRQQIPVDFLLWQKLLHHCLNIVHSCGYLNILEGTFNGREFAHFPLDFRLKHLLKQLMSPEYFQPLLFLWVSFAHSIFCNWLHLALSQNWWVVDFLLFHNPWLHGADVLLSFLFLTVQLWDKFFINFDCSVVSLSHVHFFLSYRLNLYLDVPDVLFHIELSLIVDYFVVIDGTVHLLDCHFFKLSVQKLQFYFLQLAFHIGHIMGSFLHVGLELFLGCKVFLSFLGQPLNLVF